IVWAETAHEIKMATVPSGIYLSKTCFMLIGEKLKYFQAIGNSNLIDWYARKSIHQLGQTGICASGYFMEQLPIPPITPQNLSIAEQIEKLVDQMLDAQKLYHNAKTESDKKLYKHKIDLIDKQIDTLVYELYGLTENEIKIIEESL
ncbi:MAG TPA: class I SAM-dependent DNA methyltransferase, partial [Spirochaetota bacterium]|nr:class I SAM-dependent DNA methyltransferase [Spirochaetota bacterium]